MSNERTEQIKAEIVGIMSKYTQYFQSLRRRGYFYAKHVEDALDEAADEIYNLVTEKPLIEVEAPESEEDEEEDLYAMADSREKNIHNARALVFRKYRLTLVKSGGTPYKMGLENFQKTVQELIAGCAVLGLSIGGPEAASWVKAGGYVPKAPPKWLLEQAEEAKDIAV